MKTPDVCYFLSSFSIVVFAGDTLPIDVYCHLPIMCEDRSLPYAYVPSKVVSLSEAYTIYNSSSPLWKLIFMCLCRIWARQLDPSVPHASSWSNPTMSIKKRMMSVWRRSHLCRNQSEHTSLLVFYWSTMTVYIISD